MKRIEEVIGTKAIQLENVKVDFKIKLIQYQLNNAIYKYKNKFAIPIVVSKFINDITAIIKNSDIADNKQAEELINKARNIVALCITHNKQYKPTGEELSNAVDSTLKFILYQYSKDKDTIKHSPTKQLEILDELKLIFAIIKYEDIPVTDRISNAKKLSRQLAELLVNDINNGIDD